MAQNCCLTYVLNHSNHSSLLWGNRKTFSPTVSSMPSLTRFLTFPWFKPSLLLSPCTCTTVDLLALTHDIDSTIAYYKWRSCLSPEPGWPPKHTQMPHSWNMLPLTYLTAHTGQKRLESAALHSPLDHLLLVALSGHRETPHYGGVQVLNGPLVPNEMVQNHTVLKRRAVHGRTGRNWTLWVRGSSICSTRGGSHVSQWQCFW